MIKFEIRMSKFETFFKNIVFEFVSDFGFRASDLIDYINFPYYIFS